MVEYRAEFPNSRPAEPTSHREFLRHTIFGVFGGICYSLTQHADRTFVGTGGYPNGRCASPGETITFYAVGLGPTDPLIPTGHAAPASPPATIPGASLSLVVSYAQNLLASSPAPPLLWTPIARWVYPSYIGLVAGYVGLYQVNVELPAELAQALPLTARIAIGAGSGTSDGLTHLDLCVQP